MPGREGGSRGSVRELPQWHTREGEGVRRYSVGWGKLPAPVEYFGQVFSRPGQSQALLYKNTIVIH